MLLLLVQRKQQGVSVALVKLQHLRRLLLVPQRLQGLPLAKRGS